MRIGRISRFLMFSTASIFLHAAALPMAAKLFNRNRIPAAAQVSRERIHLVELIHRPIMERIPQFPIASPLPNPAIVGIAAPPPMISSRQNPISTEERVNRPPIPIKRPAHRRTPSPLPALMEAKPAIPSASLPPPPIEQAETNVLTEAPARPPIPLEEARRAAAITVVLEGLGDDFFSQEDGLGRHVLHADPIYPVYEETAGGFIVGLHNDNALFVKICGCPEQRYHFQRQTDGSYIYLDPRGQDYFIIRADGGMEADPSASNDRWRDVVESTREIRRQMAREPQLGDSL